MKKLYLVVTLLLFVQAASSQVSVEWETRYTTTGSNNDILVDMHVDAAGFLYVTGSAFNATGTGSGFDIVTRRYDNTGAVLWTAIFNGDGNGIDQAAGLAVDASGNTYVTGYSYRGGTDFDYITIKYDVNGVEQWAVYNGGSFYDEARAIVVDNAGNVIVTGGVQPAANNTNYRTIKYSPAGAVLWTQTYSSSGNNLDMGLAVAVDANDDVYVTGHAFQTGQDLNIRTIKYRASDGNVQWNTQHQSSIINSLDTPTSIAVNSAGEVFVTGRCFNGSSFDDDMVVLKYSAAGAVVNNVTINGTANGADRGNKIVLDPSGNAYVAGKLKNTSTAEDFSVLKFNSSLDYQWTYTYNGQGSNYDEALDLAFDVSGEVYATGFSYTPSTNNDFVTVRLDLTTGQPSWLTRFNGTANNSDQAKVVRVDAAGNVYVSGESKGSGTSSDYSTIKYCQHTTFGGADEQICIGNSVQLNASGGSNYIWTPATGLSATNIPNPVANPTVTTTYIVTSESPSGCLDADTVVVVVNPLPGPVIGVNGAASFCMGDSTELYSVDAYADYLWSTSETDSAITVNQSGTYTLTVEDAMGCNNSTDIVITVFSLPTISAGQDEVICSGDTVQLTASGGVSYVWENDPSLSSLIVSNPMAFPTITKVYVVEGTDANNCSGRDTVEVVVNPLPPKPSIIKAGPDLVTDNPTGNQWFLDGTPISGGTGQTHEFTQNGGYWVVYTDGNGCSSSSDTITIVTVGLDEWGGFLQTKAYPNPGNGLYTLAWNLNATKTLDLVVTDLSGKVLLRSVEVVQNGATNQLDITRFADGVYLLHIMENTRQMGTMRLIKN